MKIDAHQHFWDPARGDYDWMPKDNPVLSRPYGPGDLAPQLEPGCGTVLVQAAATVDETEYMLQIAETAPFIKGVVGWIDFERLEDEAALTRLAAHPKFLGVRPMIQDIADDDWMHRPDVQWAYRALINHDLTFDALGFPRHVTRFLDLFQRYPELRVVVDHGMKPQIGDPSRFGLWAEGMARIAAKTGAFCKLSGLVTEAKPDWTVEDLRPYADHILSVFGPDRVMWGSDWPVVRLRCEYQGWRAAAEDLTTGLSQPERDAVFGGTAARFYRLSEV